MTPRPTTVKLEPTGATPDMTESDSQDLRQYLTEQFAAIGEQFATVRDHLVRHDEQFVAIGEQFVAIGQRFDRLNLRLDLLANEIRGDLDSLRREMLVRFSTVSGQIDGLYRHYERLEQEYLVITRQLARIEATQGDESAAREVLAQRLVELREEVAGLRARMDALQQRLGN